MIFPRALRNVAYASLLLLHTVSAKDVAKQDFAIEDYFRVQRITELALSSDGKMIAYVVERQSLEKNRPVRTVYIAAAVPGAKPEVIDAVQNAYQLTWIPRSRKLAFLSGANESTELLSYDYSSKELRPYTKIDNPITQFRFAQDGQTFAYITRVTLDKPTLYERMHSGDAGVLIDADTLSINDFIDVESSAGEAKSNLWVASHKAGSIQVPLPGNPRELHWACNSIELSVTYATSKNIASQFSETRTSVGIFDVTSEQFDVLADAARTRSGGPAISYAAAGWRCGENKLVVLRSTIMDLFVSPRHPEWATVDPSQPQPLQETTWSELSLTGTDRSPLFHLVSNTGTLINITLRGGYRSLYEPTESGSLKLSSIASSVSGRVDMLRFSADFQKAVFVNESFNHPPEVFLWQRGEGSSQLTGLNADLALTRRRMPILREINWESDDGTHVQGWLMLPDASTPRQAQWPLITFVHGGPSLPMPTGFAPYFSRWPYPFEVYALNGMAVFIPNYRGNTTFGRKFAEPEQPDQEPVEDILSGITYVLEMGLFDKERLAISGHSHGAWLGSLVMTREKIFKAGSFAEGAGNKATAYDLVSRTINEDVHDVYYGISLYDDPCRYIALSPVLHFDGVRTAVLFEAGSESAAAIYMMSYPKAAIHAGMPAEYVVYPNTGHNPSVPSVQKESAERNLNWFLFWLLENSEPFPEDVDRAAGYQQSLADM